MPWHSEGDDLPLDSSAQPESVGERDAASTVQGSDVRKAEEEPLKSAGCLRTEFLRSQLHHERFPRRARMDPETGIQSRAQHELPVGLGGERIDELPRDRYAPVGVDHPSIGARERSHCAVPMRAGEHPEQVCTRFCPWTCSRARSRRHASSSRNIRGTCSRVEQPRASGISMDQATNDSRSLPPRRSPGGA